jgi:T-complex protein 1 subunit theta
MFQQAGGLQSLLKDGARHFSGVEEAMLKNIEACKQLSTITRTSLGPYGLNKMVVNNLEKLFVTTDAATIMKELEVHHPAARLIVMAAKLQETEVGDGTNLVVILAGELLRMAEELIQTGLHPSDIIVGYEKASQFVAEQLPLLSCFEARELNSVEEVEKCLVPVVASKVYGYEKHLARCAAEACVIVTENNQKFDLDNVRVVKIQGGVLDHTKTYRGMVLSRSAEGSVKHVKNAKVAVYNCPLDPQQSDTKGTVLIKSATELKSYSRGEEEIAQKLVEDIHAAGVQVLILGGSVAEIVMHYLELKGIMVVKVNSKFEMRRVSRMLNATTVVRLGAPVPEEVGFADEVSNEEIGGTKVTLIRRESESSKVATIVIRASTQNILDDTERALDDALNTFRSMTRDNRFLPGAGACEAEIAKRVKNFATSHPGLDQYAILRYAQAFEIIPKTLAETSGADANHILSKIYAENNSKVGVDIENNAAKDLSETVVDHLVTKQWAIKLASDVALTVLRVDQIIMAKPSGGPNMNKKPVMEED